VIVVDASVLASALADDGRDGAAARSRLRGEDLAAPQLIDLEIISVLRRRHLAGTLPRDRAELALEDLGDLRLRRAPHPPLTLRCWELRHTVTPYDAAYVALAERLGAVLLTADGRLARAPGLNCDIELLLSQ
jgi:predicted nucleic acid-binding protein